MTAAARQRPAWLTPRAAGIGLTALVVAAMALDTTYRDADAPRTTANGRPAFDRDAYGRDTFPRIAQAIEQQATPLPRLLAALREDPQAAGERFGHREGNAAYSFPVRGEGVAGAVKGGTLPLTVEGVPDGTTVAVQIGPALPGTAVRDATGEISFGQFVNQVEFADAATALNNEVKTQVLADLEPARLDGRRVRFVGAFTFLAPAAVTITPVELEPAS